MDNNNAATEIRRMTPLDVPFGMRLREIVGWNQTERDWHRFLTLEPQGCFVACLGEEKCGTVTTLRYEDRCGWIGMLLVDPAYRGQGIGTRLLRQGMSYLHHEKVETLKLDATPMGHPLYLQLGFEDEYSIERWEGISHVEARSGDRVMTIDEVNGTCQWDLEVFGADRQPLLTSLWREGPRYSAVAYSDNGISGYVLGRKGSRAHYLGPWVARPGSGAAEELFYRYLGRVPGEQVFVDICCENVEARGLVESAGFRHQRILTRMYQGPNRYPGLPHFVCGIAGPELG